MVDIATYATLQKELLELEREEEKRESIASGDGKKLSSLELNGLAICRLCIDSVSSDVGGRQVVRLVTRGGRQLAPARISTGDLVAIREQKGRESTAGPPGASSVTEGVVTALDDRSVEVACDEPLSDDFDGGSALAVTKITSNVTHKRYTNSLDALERAADNPTHDAYSLIHILFGDAPPRFQSNIRLDAKQERFMSALNEKQKDAVMNALKAKDLAVIHGPPGTGKTHTLIAYIMIEALRGSRVLVVAPSNVAVDNIAERLAAVDPSPEFVRAGHPARIMPRVLKHSLDYQIQATDEAKLAADIRDELNGLEGKVRKTCEKSKRRAIRMEQRELRKELKKREKTAVQRLLSRKDVVLSTITGAGARVLDIAQSKVPFDVVIVDEAAQALEAACWVSLLRARKAVLAGDPHQLAGTVKSVTAESRGLKRSILDRVFTSQSLHPTISMLVTQYRMNEIISTWSSQEFYDCELQPDASVANRRVVDMESCKNKQDDEEALVHPFILIDTAGGDCEEDEQSANDEEQASHKAFPSNAFKASRSNKGEAQILIDMVSTFVQCGIALQDIGVISPYSGQVELLRNHLWPKYGRSLEVATIDSFQGREKEIVCMSLVRSNEAGEVGFLSDDRRMNVAITRARRCVVIVCDTETISVHPLLARMVEYVENHGHYRSAVVDFPDIVGTFSQSRRPKEAIEAEERSESIRRRQNKAPSREPRITGRGNRFEKKPIDALKDDWDDKSDEVREQLRKEITGFLLDESNSQKIFSVNLSALERRVLHELAEEYGVNHQSFGEQGERRIKLWKEQKQTHVPQDDSSTVDGFSTRPSQSEISATSEGYLCQASQDTPQTDDMSTRGQIAPSIPSEYKDVNNFLGDLSKAREDRAAVAAQEESATDTPKLKKKGKNKRKGRRKRDDSEEDFDAVLAEYGAKQDEAGPSRFSGPVAQIVNGKLTAKVSAPKGNAEARRKLAAKLSKEAEKRKRQQKR